MIEMREGRLPGCRQLMPLVREDSRGVFVKPYEDDWFIELGLPTQWPERFYSRSHRGVVRGLHLQAPPADHDKLVYCVSGAVLDVVVDLRLGSPTYGAFEAIELDDQEWATVFVPRGIAHGFAALADDTVMAYAVSSVHNPTLDIGIRWDSVSIPWPFEEPIISERDAALPALADFCSPFVYAG